MNMESQKKLDEILQSIKDGDIYAHVESVSPSGMSRRIKFYRVELVDDGKYINKPIIRNITAEIGWLSEELKRGEYKKGGKYVYDDGLLVKGCGMDMIFHTLYKCIPFADRDKWSQKYNTL